MTTSTRRRKLRALAEAHDAWVQRHLTDVAAEFTPREDGSDYNIHNVDVDADGAAEDELAAVAAEIFNAGEPLTADANFEDKHPRDAEGQFTDKADVSFDFLSDDDVLAMHREMQGDEPWTPEQHEALGHYAETVYYEINGMLRDTLEVPAPVRRELQKLVDEINGAMRPTTRDLRTSRWVAGLGAFGLNEDFTWPAQAVAALEPLRGKRFREPGFLSTSTQSDWTFDMPDAERYDEDAEEEVSTVIAVEIDVPRGTPAAYLSARGGPGLAGEGELLLGSGREVELVDVFLRDDVPTVRLRVVS